MNSAKYKFNYENIYYKNGNVKSQELTGEYSDNFSKAADLTFSYKYDRSNRLTEAVTANKNFDVTNTFDKDGNILTLDRNGSTGYSLDDFNYSYYSGTNKLSKVKGSSNQYAYDLNGNMITDSLNSNFNIQYDYRNLITQLTHRVIASLTIADTSFYLTKYYYDEAGNRIRKKVYNDENDSLLSDVIYSRDVSGKEMAVYENGTLKQWNIWGTDNAGYINANGDKRFYLKDHLGSVRAVVDEEGSVVSSQDYDAWGYLLQDRTFDSEENIYKFTSKERDDESKYDYFGARYYDARIGRWGGVEPNMEKYLQLSPYNYSLNNPLKFTDLNGKDAIYIFDSKNKTLQIIITLNYSRNEQEHNMKNFFLADPRGSNDQQIEFLKQFKENVESAWSGKFEINGTEYTVNTSVNLVSFASSDVAATYTQKNKGQNFVSNAQKGDYIEGNIGVGSNIATLFLKRDLNPRKDTPSHEVGHLFGLPDLGEGSTLMSYNENRRGPTDYEFKGIFGANKNLNVNIFGNQIVTGYKK